jgi:hypothetical protein
MTHATETVSETCPFNIGRVVNAHIVLGHDLCDASAGLGFEECDASICPYTLGDWGAWRSFADHHMAMVFLHFWCAHVNGWAWDALHLGRLLRDAIPQLAEPVGWSP